jgi:hypothetical protein
VVVAAVLALVAVAAACDPGPVDSAGPTAGPGLTATVPTSSTVAPAPSTLPPSTTSTQPPTTVAPSVRERLAVLAIDDRPSPEGSYRRDDWPHWDDVDGNGCDARQDALIRWTTTTPTLDTSRRCKVLAGTWPSPYDGRVASSPSEVEIDHLVPLAEAFRSGGWRWDAGQRRRFANDQAELVATSSSSNRSKGDSTPDEWRPARREAWCAYADRYVTVKAGYGLSVTTEERDALGQMLDTCGPGSDTWP